MERFRVSFRDQVHTIGLSEPGVILMTVCSVIRENPAGELLEHECTLNLGGLDSKHINLEWLRDSLNPGDRIGIEILGEGPSDPPLSSKGPVPLEDVPEEPNDEIAEDDEHAELREAAEELGWTLIEEPSASAVALVPSPESPPVPVLPASSINTSSTNGMERFCVSLRGQTHTIGVPGPGVLSAFLCAVVRQDPGDGPEHECTLELGGLYSSDTDVKWPKYDLQAGDHIDIEILPEGSFDEPASQRTQAQTAAEWDESKRSFVRKAAKELGWTIIENHSLSD